MPSNVSRTLSTEMPFHDETNTKKDGILFILSVVFGTNYGIFVQKRSLLLVFFFSSSNFERCGKFDCGLMSYVIQRLECNQVLLNEIDFKACQMLS